MELHGKNSFFIGSNSGAGYASFYETLYDRDRMKHVFLIKGGPGNGKSTLMKKLAAEAEKRGFEVERIHCPSSPTSLDAAVCSGAGFAVLDATPPHGVEALYHGVLEEYVSLSGFLDIDGVKPLKEEVFSLSDKIAEVRREAYVCLRAAREISGEILSEILPGVDTGKLANRGGALARKYIPQNKNRSGGQNPVKKRFLSGNSPGGVFVFRETPEAVFRAAGTEKIQKIEIEDDLGLSPFLLGPVYDRLCLNGYGFYACYDPLVPARLTELIVPELGVHLASAAKLQKDGEAEARLFPGKAITPEHRRRIRNRLSVLKKTRESFVERACALFLTGNELHDMLERLFVPRTDFDGLDRLADSLIERAFG